MSAEDHEVTPKKEPEKEVVNEGAQSPTTTSASTPTPAPAASTPIEAEDDERELLKKEGSPSPTPDETDGEDEEDEEESQKQGLWETAKKSKKKESANQKGSSLAHVAALEHGEKQFTNIVMDSVGAMYNLDAFILGKIGSAGYAAGAYAANKAGDKWRELRESFNSTGELSRDEQTALAEDTMTEDKDLEMRPLAKSNLDSTPPLDDNGESSGVAGEEPEDEVEMKPLTEGSESTPNKRKDLDPLLGQVTTDRTMSKKINDKTDKTVSTRSRDEHVDDADRSDNGPPKLS